MTADETRDAQSVVEEVLAVHWAAGMAPSGEAHQWECECGQPLDMSDEAHRAHVAAALAEVIAAERAKALRSAAAEVYGATGQSAGVPVWRADIADWLRRRANREQP